MNKFFIDLLFVEPNIKYEKDNAPS